MDINQLLETSNSIIVKSKQLICDCKSITVKIKLKNEKNIDSLIPISHQYNFIRDYSEKTYINKTTIKKVSINHLYQSRYSIKITFQDGGTKTLSCNDFFKDNENLWTLLQIICSPKNYQELYNKYFTDYINEKNKCKGE